MASSQLPWQLRPKISSLPMSYWDNFENLSMSLLFVHWENCSNHEENVPSFHCPDKTNGKKIVLIIIILILMILTSTISCCLSITFCKVCNQALASSNDPGSFRRISLLIIQANALSISATVGFNAPGFFLKENDKRKCSHWINEMKNGRTHRLFPYENEHLCEGQTVASLDLNQF